MTESFVPPGYLRLSDACLQLAFGAPITLQDYKRRFPSAEEFGGLDHPHAHSSDDASHRAMNRILEAARMEKLPILGHRAVSEFDGYFPGAFRDVEKIGSHVFLRVTCIGYADPYPLLGIGKPFRPVWFHPLVSVLALKAAFNDFQGATDAQRKGGPPLKYDWNAIDAEAMRALDENGDVDVDDPEWNQARLEQQMLSWCLSSFGKEPGLSTIRKRVPKWREAHRVKCLNSGRH